jgi:hypothetical protein
MSTFGPFNFKVTSKASKPKIGQLTLNYTLNADGTITNASVDYVPPAGTNNSNFTVTFDGVGPVYSGNNDPDPIPNNWNVPGEGAYKHASFLFKPPAAGSGGTLTGTATKDSKRKDDPSITWESDPSVVPEKGDDDDGRHEHHHHKGQHAGK